MNERFELTTGVMSEPLVDHAKVATRQLPVSKSQSAMAAWGGPSAYDVISVKYGHAQKECEDEEEEY